MKILIILFILFFAVPCSAEVYVTYDKQTKEIFDISEQDDAVVPEGYEKKVLKGSKDQIPDMYEAKYYKLAGNKVVLNNKKLNTDMKRQKEETEKLREEYKVMRMMQKMACEQLKASGEKLKHISCDEYLNGGAE